MQKPAAATGDASEQTAHRALPFSASTPGASAAASSLEAACRLALVNLARISAHRAQAVVSWHLHGAPSSAVSAPLLSTARDLQYALAEAFPDRVLSPFGGTYELGAAAAVEPAARLLQFSCAAVLDPRAAAAAMEGMPYKSVSRAAREMVRVVAELLRAPSVEPLGLSAPAAAPLFQRRSGIDGASAPRVGSSLEASPAAASPGAIPKHAKRPPLAAKERLGIRLTGLEPDLVARDLFMHFSQFGDVVRASVSLTLGPGAASSMAAAVHFTELEGVVQSLANSPHTIKGRSVAAVAFTGRTERAAAGAQSDAATDAGTAADDGGEVRTAPEKVSGGVAATTAPVEGGVTAAAAPETALVLSPSGLAAGSVAEAPVASPLAPEAEERFFLRLRGLPPTLTAADVKSRFSAYGAIGRVKVSSAIGTSSEHDGLVSYTSLDTSALGALGRQVVIRGYPVALQLALSPAQHMRVREERSAAKAAAAAAAKTTSARDPSLEPMHSAEPPAAGTAAAHPVVPQAGEAPSLTVTKLQLPSLVLYGAGALPSNASVRQYFGRFGEVTKFKRWNGSGDGSGRGGGRNLLGFVRFPDVPTRERALAAAPHVIEGVAFTAERARPPPLVNAGGGATASAERPAVSPAGVAALPRVAAYPSSQTAVASSASIESPPGTSSPAAMVSLAEPLAAGETAAAHASEASAVVAAFSPQAAANAGFAPRVAPLPASPPVQTTLALSETSTTSTSLTTAPRAPHAAASHRPTAAAKTAAPQGSEAHAATPLAPPPHPVAVPVKDRHLPSATPQPVLAAQRPIPAALWRAASHEVAAELQRLAAATPADCSTATGAGRTTAEIQPATAEIGRTLCRVGCLDAACCL
jgi:hypothetical protein